MSLIEKALNKSSEEIKSPSSQNNSFDLDPRNIVTVSPSRRKYVYLGLGGVILLLALVLSLWLFFVTPEEFGQPAHVNDWVATCSDNEGVHSNSGIPNKAFYNIAVAIGKAKAERVFYRALTIYLHPTASLEDTRAAVIQAASDLYGPDSEEKETVRAGFNDVGLDGQWHPPSNDCACGVQAAISSDIP